MSEKFQLVLDVAQKAQVSRQAGLVLRAAPQPRPVWSAACQPTCSRPAADLPDLLWLFPISAGI